MANKLNGRQKLGVTIGVLILLGGGGYIVWRLLTKKRRECQKAGGTWDKATKTCKLPEKPNTEIVKKTQDNLNFESGKDVILPSSYASLDELATYLNGIPALELTIEGHTDSQGDEDYNQKLSENRANSVKKYLVNKGIAENRIKAVGFGEMKPIADNKTLQGREKNRRVEFIIA